jgi:peptidoglycan/LPS O-acetylase OafA/YrhL
MMLRNMIAIYSLFIGILMVGMWSVFIITGQVPEFTLKPAEITLHLIAEFTTSILLIIAGISILKRKRIGYNLNLVALGMLLYTLIASPGYYIQKGEPVFVGMFTIFLILTLISLVISFKKQYEIKLERLS